MVFSVTEGHYNKYIGISISKRMNSTKQITLHVVRATGETTCMFQKGYLKLVSRHENTITAMKLIS